MARPKINRRKNGLIEKKVRVPDGKGGFTRKSIYNRDSRQLEIKVTEIKDQVNKNIFIPKSKITFETAANKWLASLPSSLAESTKEGYSKYVRYAINLRGPKEVQSFLPLDIQVMYNEYVNEVDENGEPKRGQNSLKHLHFVVNAIFNFLVINKVLRENPCGAIGKTIKLEDFEPYVYNEEEFVELLKKVYDTEDEVIIALAGGAGLRAGEICAIKKWEVELVDLGEVKASRISVNNSRFRVKGKVGEKSPKSKNSTRQFLMDRYIYDAVERHLKRRTAESDYILCRSTGKPYLSEELWDKFTDALLRHNMPKTRLHDLRHYCATMMAIYGIDIVTAAKILGDTPAVVMKFYQHVQEKMKKNAALKMGKMFAPLYESETETSQSEIPSINTFVVNSVVNEKREQDLITTLVPSNPTLN
jgi:integrase